MNTKPLNKADPFEQLIESAFRPGTFVPDGQCFVFVRRLAEAAATIDRLVAIEALECNGNTAAKRRYARCRRASPTTRYLKSETDASLLRIRR
jgi:hypothetical protein